MIATSQPRATAAGLRAFEAGGNAIDAALAAAAVLCVTEPMSTGVGGDAFACVWHGGKLFGLDAAGPAPAVVDRVEPVDERGPRSVTVPGAVAGWEALSKRFGRLGLDACLGAAIDVAEHGFSVAPMAAAAWASGEGASTSWAVAAVPPEYEPVPRAGARVRLPELAGTLRRIAEEGSQALYEGAIARAICEASWLDESDLTGYRARWVEPLRARYGPFEVIELPPPTQGVVALEALALLDPLEPSLANLVRCVELALEDAARVVRDGADVSPLLAEEYLAARRSAPGPGAGEPGGGTVYLCAVDGDGTAVSFIQSLFGGFGSGIVAPGTGIVLQNRGACFARAGRVEPGRRPYHTIIPGMLLRDGALAGPFGVMGGFIQAQAHVQFVSAVADDGLDPQAALDRPRFRVEAEAVCLEEGLWDRADELERAGYRVRLDSDTLGFGGGQAILVDDGVLLGGSDPRKDGYAGGL
jgi:gamma-glutamyltranspeptidase/glutathione hydrolase